MEKNTSHKPKLQNEPVEWLFTTLRANPDKDSIAVARFRRYMKELRKANPDTYMHTTNCTVADCRHDSINNYEAIRLYAINVRTPERDIDAIALEEVERAMKKEDFRRARCIAHVFNLKGNEGKQ